MDVLIRFGFTIEEIKTMMDANLDIESVQDNHIQELIQLLKELGLGEGQIKNIFICNPFCLTRELKKVKNTINRFKKLEFTHLYSLLDSNPYLLNVSSEEINDIYENKMREGLTKDEVIDYFTHTIVF